MNEAKLVPLYEAAVAHMSRRLSGINCRVREVRSELPKILPTDPPIDHLYLSFAVTDSVVGENSVTPANIGPLYIDPVADQLLKVLDGKHYMNLYRVVSPRDGIYRRVYQVRNVPIMSNMTYDAIHQHTQISLELYAERLPD